MALWLLLALLLLAGTGYAVTAPPSTFTGRGPADFIAWLGPIARDSQIRTGIPASVVIAQAALESAWGDSRLIRDTGNAFGVKAGRSWTGRVISATTTEVINGVRIRYEGTWRQYVNATAALADNAHPQTIFRVYPSTLESVRDHARVLYNGLYERALAHRSNAEAFAYALEGTYATEPGYGQLVVNVMRGRNLTTWDVPPEQWQLDASIVPPKHRETWRAAMAARGVSV